MSDESLSALQEDIINRVKDVCDKGLTYTEDFLVYSHLWSDDRQVRNEYVFWILHLQYDLSLKKNSSM